MYIFIVNPAAGSGKAGKVYKNLQQHTFFQHLTKRCFVTSYQGHIEIIMQEVNQCCVTDEVRAILVLGGDGTMHEVLNHLDDPHIPVSFIPGGSGNDFARNFEQPCNVKDFLERLTEDQPADPYWPGRFCVAGQESRLFLNCIGFGFDAIVAQSANRSRWKKRWNKLKVGKLVYLFSLVRELLKYEPIAISVLVDGTAYTFPRCLFLTVNNQPYFGGGMKINPNASNNPDTFGIIVVDSISKWKVLALFLTVFFGKHLAFKEVRTFRGESITLESKSSIPFQSDGETSQTTKAVIEKHDQPFWVNGCRKEQRPLDVPLPK